MKAHIKARLSLLFDWLLLLAVIVGSVPILVAVIKVVVRAWTTDDD